MGTATAPAPLETGGPLEVGLEPEAEADGALAVWIEDFC